MYRRTSKCLALRNHPVGRERGKVRDDGACGESGEAKRERLRDAIDTVEAAIERDAYGGDEEIAS